MVKYPHWHKVLITGERYWDDQLAWDAVDRTLEALAREHKRLLVITGGATGIDSVAIQLCSDLGIHCAVVRAMWARHPRAAGPIRNQAMLALRPQEVVAFHRNLRESKGTLDMVRRARKHGLRVRAWRA